MQNLSVPVRRGGAVDLTYTFKDQANAVIDLTGYDTFTLEAKVQGQAYAGTVTVAGFAFDTAGIWQVQFVATQAAQPAVKLYGEPMQLKVVKNVEDAGLDELLEY